MMFNWYIQWIVSFLSLSLSLSFGNFIYRGKYFLMYYIMIFQRQFLKREPKNKILWSLPPLPFKNASLKNWQIIRAGFWNYDLGNNENRHCLKFVLFSTQRWRVIHKLAKDWIKMELILFNNIYCQY